MPRVDRFIEALSRVEVSDRACNQYAPGERANAIRRSNLQLYLQQIGNPRMLLVGEAPSYRGGRLTGIPFTSESIMMRLLDGHRGYRKATLGPRLSTEASATMVWATIQHIEPLPLLWNAFPFHPFVAGNPFSNRIPTTGELLVGAPFLEWLLQLFPIERVVAVGNLAERSLTRLGIEHVKVRHPSQGGKRKFIEGLARL
ncbi:MAG TPA: uracil-DNA glycosylase [Thermoanaerobaculia bacterium]